MGTGAVGFIRTGERLIFNGSLEEVNSLLKYGR